MKTVDKLVNLFDKELHSDLKKVLITCDKGVYTLFGKYLVRPFNGNFRAIEITSNETAELVTLKHAMTWCTLRNSDKWVASARLETLDLKLSSLNVDIAVHRRMLKLATTEEGQSIYLTKLQEDSYKRRQIVREINTFITDSLSIQSSNFSKAKEHKFIYN